MVVQKVYLTDSEINVSLPQHSSLMIENRTAFNLETSGSNGGNPSAYLKMIEAGGARIYDGDISRNLFLRLSTGGSGEIVITTWGESQ